MLPVDVTDVVVVAPPSGDAVVAGKKEKPLSAMLTIAVGLGPSAEIRKYHILHLHIYILCCLLGYIYISTSIVAYQATFTYLHILLNTGLHLHIYILCCIHLHIYNFCCILATFTYLQLLLHTGLHFQSRNRSMSHLWSGYLLSGLSLNHILSGLF